MVWFEKGHAGDLHSKAEEIAKREIREKSPKLSQKISKEMQKQDRYYGRMRKAQDGDN